MLPVEAAYPTVEKGRLPVVRSRNTSPLRWWAIARRVYVLDVVQRAAAGFWRHGAAIYAAAMSYYVLLTLFPLLILVVAVVGLLAHDPAVEERIVGVILGRFPAEVNLRPSVEAVVSGVARTNPGLLGAVVGAGGQAGAGQCLGTDGMIPDVDARKQALMEHANLDGEQPARGCRPPHRDGSRRFR